MKAIRYHGPKDMRYEDVEIPKIKDDEALIKVKSASLCGTDLEVYHGTMAYVAEKLTAIPFIPGHEWGGEIVELGKNVKNFKIGDKVSGECSIGCRECKNCLLGNYNRCLYRRETGLLNKEGGFAEYIAFPYQFLHKSETLSFDELSLIEPVGVSVYCTKTVKVTPSDYVAVTGPGPIGLFAVQAAKAYGAKGVLLTGTRDERLELGKKLGADIVVNVKKENLSDIAKDFTGGELFDVVLESSGNISAIDDIEKMIKPMGRIGIMGLFSGKKGAFNLDKLVIENITIYGTLGSPNVWDESISLIENKKINAKALITHKLPLKEFEKGLEMMEKRLDNSVKIVLEP